MPKQVVAKDNLSTDFDLGVAIANKLAVNIDGVTIVRDGSGKLKVQLNDEDVTSNFSGTNYLDAISNVEDALSALDTAVDSAVNGVTAQVESVVNEELQDIFGVQLGYIRPV